MGQRLTDEQRSKALRERAYYDNIFKMASHFGQRQESRDIFKYDNQLVGFTNNGKLEMFMNVAKSEADLIISKTLTIVKIIDKIGIVWIGHFEKGLPHSMCTPAETEFDTQGNPISIKFHVKGKQMDYSKFKRLKENVKQDELMRAEAARQTKDLTDNIGDFDNIRRR